MLMVFLLGGLMLSSCRYRQLRAREASRAARGGLADWGYSPGQRRLANVAYPLVLRQRRINDGGVVGFQDPVSVTYEGLLVAPSVAPRER